MAVTVQTILRSAASRGSFVGVTLKTRSPNLFLEGTVKVDHVSRNYVTLLEYDKFGSRIPMKVHKNTIRQVRGNGVARNTRSR